MRLGRLRRHLPPLGVAFLVEAGQREEGVLALRGDLGRRAVGAEEVVDGKFIERDQPRHPPRHLRMSGQRAVLGPRQRQPRLHLGKDGRGAGHRSGGQRENWERRIHATSASRSI